MPLSPKNRDFKAATNQADVPAPVYRPLSFVRSATVKSLYWSHRAIQLLSVLWLLLGVFCIGLGLSAFAGQVPQIQPDDASLIGSGLLLLGILAIVTGIGCLLRTGWGRICGIILCLVQLIKVPFGTVLGVFGLFFLIRSSQLFGATRFSGGEMVEEYRLRKTQYGA